MMLYVDGEDELGSGCASGEFPAHLANDSPERHREAEA
jgi:hypothetical protein